METKFTPGPWTISGTMTKFIEARIGGGWVQEIAGVGPTASDNGYGEQQEANAHLVAAAPRMYAELLSVRETVQALINEGYTGYCEHRDRIDEVLAKARGEQ